MRYAPYFCEENVWHLTRERPMAQALFVTNRARTVAVWEQRTGDPVVWDYHVVLVDGATIVDLDTAIAGGPILPAHTWLDRSFRPASAPFAPVFRLVDAGQLLATFASDRSHMRDESGAPVRPFPPWPLISCDLGTHTLPRYLDLDDAIAGEVLDLAALRARLAL